MSSAVTVWRFASGKKAKGLSLPRRLVYAASTRLGARMEPAPLKTSQTAGALLKAAQRVRMSSLAQITGGGPVIILAPHPDDETLGCGGLLAACAAKGVAAHVFILTDGGLSHPQGALSRSGLASLRRHETGAALRALGLPPSALKVIGLKDGRALLDRHRLQRAAVSIARFAQRVNATSLFVAWRHDPHPDHMAAAIAAGWVQRIAPRLRVLHYPIRGRFLPPKTKLRGAWTPLRFDARRYLKHKRKAMAAYRSQTTPLITAPAMAFRFRADEMKPFLGPTEMFFEQKR